MKRIRMFALSGAALATVLAPAGALAANGPKVTVRVEGRSRTLLAASTVRTHTGFITRNGAPSGACSATSAAGALDVATHHRWGASYSTSFANFLIQSILGERQTTNAFYWGVWINDRYASAGVCGIGLRTGDSLLFAVDSVAHHEHPIKLASASRTRVGRALSVKVSWFSDAGVAKPLAGARVAGSGISAVTNGRGIAQIKPAKAGRLVLQASRSGYVRAQAVRVSVQR